MSKIFMNRRHFLQNAGIASLAFSPLITSSRALADTGVKPRLLFIMLQHGVGGPGGAKGTEHNFTFSPWLSPLTPIREHVTLVDGLFGTWWGNAHDESYAHLLTGSAAPAKRGAPRTPSVETFLEQKLGKGVLPAQRLISWAGGSARSNGALSLCYDTHLKPISLQTGTLAQAAILNNVGGVQSNEAKLRALREKRKKILDEVAGELKTLRSRLTVEEKIKLDQFTNSINETASALGLNGTIKTGGNCQAPTSIPKEWWKIQGHQRYELGISSQFSNLKTAFACNLTRFGVLRIGEVPHDIYDWKDSSGKTRRGKPCGSSVNFHQCVAHYKDLEGRLCFEGSVKWSIQKIADFAKELDAIKEPNGHTLLENTIIVISGEVGDGNHDRNRKPFLVIGGRGAPGLKTGRHIKIPQQLGWTLKTPDGDIKQQPFARVSQRTEPDFWREICEAMGVKLKTFGSPYLNRGRIGLL